MSGGNKKCPGCGKSVYFAEKLDGINGDWWHKLCFRCSQQECKKIMGPGNFHEHDGKLYCKRCYDSHFRHQGYGFGGLDSFKDPHGVHPESEVVQDPPVKP